MPLHEFLVSHHDQIVDRTREKMHARPWPSASTKELEHGVPLFLAQLSLTLNRTLMDGSSPFTTTAIGASATKHGGELLRLGFTLSEVVHDYGDICQAITEMALEEKAPISMAEFNTLNSCLDNAIAEAVTEHNRISSAKAAVEETERMGYVTHQIRDLLNTALMAYQVLKRGTVAINGVTGTVLGSSLVGLRDFIESQMSEIRLLQPNLERMRIADIVKAAAEAGTLHADIRRIAFIVQPVNIEWEVNTDAQLLQSALTNLLNNAFKFTKEGGTVVLRTHVQNNRVLIEVEDECGGMAEKPDFKPFQQRRAVNRSGLGLGLSIARKAVAAHEGDIRIRNIPNLGCIFTIDLPLARQPAWAGV